jgi:hypothetical protein
MPQCRNLELLIKEVTFGMVQGCVISKMQMKPKYVQKFRSTRFSVLIYIDVCVTYDFVVVGCHICGVHYYAMCIIHVFYLPNVDYLYVISNHLHRFIEQQYSH